MKANVKVYEIPLSSKIIKEFSKIEDLLKENKTAYWFADQIEINGMILIEIEFKINLNELR